MQGVTNPAKHLIKGLYPWLAENDPMVYFTFNINHPGVHLTPNSFRQETVKLVKESGNELEIITTTLNLDPAACGKVRFEEEFLFMQCRSNGQLVECSIPYEAMIRMWCPRDQTGILMVMPPYRYPETPVVEEVTAGDDTSVSEQSPAEPARPGLRRIK